MGQAFLHGNGGSNPLNFKVVASADYPDSTSRNMIPDAYAKTATSNGITYTVNGDGSITANGTATGLSVLNVWGNSNSLTLPAGTYTLSGCPSGGAVDTYRLCNNATSINDTGSGVTFTLTEDTAISFKIRIQSGTTVSNLKFWPQLEKGSSKTSFVKYAQKGNTIWVKTSETVVSWKMAKQSSIPTLTSVKGRLFISYSSIDSVTTTNTNFDALKITASQPNSIMVGLNAAYLNLDGTSSGWKQVYAYIYKSSGWVQFSSEFSATIKVTYPSGSTLTCSNGSTTLTATTTTGSYTFTVPNSGTWTVKAVSGSNTASQSVSITTSGQSASVTLTYEVYLYNAGDQCTSLTGGWSNKEKGASYAGSGSVTLDTSAMIIACNTTGSRCAYTTKAIALSGKTTLHVTISSMSNLSSTVPAGIWVATDTTVTSYSWANVVAYKYDITNTGTFTVDVSSLTTSCYIAIGIDSAGGAGSITVSKVWLT